MRIYCLFFLLTQVLFSQNIKEYNIRTSLAILEKVKITDVQKFLIKLDDSTKVHLSDIKSLSSFSDVNLFLPTIVGGICGYGGGACGLVTGTLLGFGFAEKGKGTGSTAAPWAAFFTWNDNKQLPSLYIGMGLGAVYGYRKFFNYLYKKSENYTDMEGWSVERKYDFFNQLFYPTKNIAIKLNNNFNQPLQLKELVSLAESDAVKSFGSNNYQILGAGSCLFGWVGVPAAILFVESGIMSSFNSNNSNYIELDSEQKFIYKKSFKDKEKRLKRKSVYQSQLGCFGLMNILLMTGTLRAG